MRTLSARFLAALAGVAATATLAIAPAHAAPAGQTATAGSDFASSAARTADGRVIDDAATKADVIKYWTPERMRAATPAHAPRVTGPAAHASRTQDGARAPKVVTEPVTAPASTRARANSVAPSSALAVGKVYFIDPRDGREHQCSAAVVSSPKGKLVQTAAHCVYSHTDAGTPVGWMQGWVFVPAYSNGSAPFGYWVAENLAAPTAYINDKFTPGTDIGMAIMATDLGGTPILYVVGGNGLIVNQPASLDMTVFGYPAQGNYQGNLQQLSCAGRTAQATSTQILMRSCPFTPGASGGPWMLDYDPGIGYGYVNSVSSAIYCNDAACTRLPTDPVYGEYFGDLEAGLYYYAEAVTT